MEEEREREDYEDQVKEGTLAGDADGIDLPKVSLQRRKAVQQTLDQCNRVWRECSHE